MSAVVITPTTCNLKLLDAVYSIRDQSYPNVKHLIVVDGKEYSNQLLVDIKFINSNIEIVQLQTNTGAGGFNGQRIYASFPHLVNEDYIFYLDQDNWFERNHISSVISTIEKNNYDWAYSLRNIVNTETSIQDNCESLGKWPVWNDKNQYLIDTSCYGFKREFLIRVANIWHMGQDFRWGEDRRFLHILRNQIKHTNFGCTGKYTLNYRLDGNPNSVKIEYFEYGNSIYTKLYNNKFPWTKS